MREKGARIKTVAIVPAAGKGARFRSKEKKVLANLNKRPVLSYALKKLQTSPLIEEIILVIDMSLLRAAEGLIRHYKITKVKYIVEGGKTRAESVRRGLNFVDKDMSLVLIHDGVRPLVTTEIIQKTIAAAKRFGASVSAVPVKATIKVSKNNSFVKYTPDRNRLWEVQTPQVFKKDLIIEAYKKTRRNKIYSDDAALLEHAGKKVKIVKGDYNNIKITTVEDIRIAEALL